jgi:sulfate adenylyltransferase subunit 2
MMMNQRTIQVGALEIEVIYILREVVSLIEKSVLLFLSGNDSGHNFPETIEFRERLVAELSIDFIR